MDVDLVITDRSGAGKILCSPAQCSRFRYVISIGVPPDRPPAGWRKANRRLRLEFEDSVAEADGGPSEADVARVIQFAEQIRATPGGVLVHCQAGISRSSAAAAIVLAVLLGPGREVEALRRVYKSQPAARPNARMLELADIALGRSGALVQAAATVGV